jgi:hypothetical protein
MTEEGITRLKNALRRFRRYAIGAAVVAVIIGYAYNRYYTRPHLSLLQRMYLPQYEYTIPQSFVPFFKFNYWTLIALPYEVMSLDMPPYTTDENIEPVMNDDGRAKLDSRGLPIFRLKRASKINRPSWGIYTSSAEDRKEWLRLRIYGGKTLFDIWQPAISWAIIIFIVGTGLCVLGDSVVNRCYLRGKSIRGTRIVPIKLYARQNRSSLGYRIKAYEPDIEQWVLKLRQLIGLSVIYFILTVPRKEETEGLLILGDPGTGKTQIMHQVLCEINRRRPAEALVCYDPEGEFFKNHGDPRNDNILNPLDHRCPFWSPGLEINYQNPIAAAADRKMITECLLPYRRFTGTNGDFFIDAGRSVLGRIFEVETDLNRICEILSNENLIDEIVAGTELAHLISPGAKGQRGGVLATLSTVAELLRLLPRREQCTKELSLTQWAKQRQGRIFITSKHDSRDALGGLQAAWINILMKRLLAADLEWSKEHPCWLVVDEVHALKHLSALPIVIVEGRKHGLKIVVGTQNKTQLEEHYGSAAPTMLASFHTKIFFRCNEPESARWVSNLIGDLETEKPRMGTTASVQRNARDSINTTTMTEVRPVVSKEEIMALPNLHGYWKHETFVVRFRIRPLIFQNTNKSFIERTGPPIAPPSSRPIIPSNPNGHEPHEIVPNALDDLDLSF